MLMGLHTHKQPNIAHGYSTGQRPTYAQYIAMTSYVIHIVVWKIILRLYTCKNTPCVMSMVVERFRNLICLMV